MPSLCHLAVCLLLAGPLHQPGERWLPLHPRRALTLLAPSLGLRPPPCTLPTAGGSLWFLRQVLRPRVTPHASAFRVSPSFGCLHTGPGAWPATPEGSTRMFQRWAGLDTFD